MSDTPRNTIELNRENTIILCDSCVKKQPECEAVTENKIYGTGKGCDNVSTCNVYEAFMYNDYV